MMKIEVDLKNLPSEAPAWATHLQLSINAMIRLQVHTLRRLGHVEEDIKMTDRSVDDLIADIASEKTQIAGLSALTDGIKAKLDAALANVTIPADVQAKINAAFEGVEANKQMIMDAINKDTDAAGADPSAPAAPETGSDEAASAS
jgi:hypothetical protein